MLAFLFNSQSGRPRTIAHIVSVILTSVALFSTHPAVKHHHAHHTKGCNTHICDVRVGKAWAEKYPKFHWTRTGASIFGNPCESGNQGYRGAELNGRPEIGYKSYLPPGWYFAELGMGSALGGLPSGAKVVVRSPSTHRQTIIVKGDIGAGGGNVEGLPRTFDLYAPLAKWLANASCEWTGVIEWAHVR